MASAVSQAVLSPELQALQQQESLAAQLQYGLAGQGPAQALLNVAQGLTPSPSGQAAAQAIGQGLQQLTGVIGGLMNLMVLLVLVPLISQMPGVTPELAQSVEAVGVLGILVSLVQLLVGLVRPSGSQATTGTGSGGPGFQLLS